MQLKDSAPQAKELKGHFCIQRINAKTGEILDTYEENNLIVNKARETMATMLVNRAGKKGIVKFRMGTQGHDPATKNILVPRITGQDGYTEERTQLFSQDTDDFFYTISWDPDALLDNEGFSATWNEDTNSISFIAKGEKKMQKGNEDDAESFRIPVTQTINQNMVTYVFTIPELAANGSDGNSVIAYTEAGLISTDEDLFSIKCFPAKVKNIDTKFVITWKIIF